MPFPFTCPVCGRTSQVPEQLAGVQAKCPFCATVVVIPKAAAALAPRVPSIPVVAPIDDGLIPVISPSAPKAGKSGGVVIAGVVVLAGLAALFCCGGGSGLAYWLLFYSGPTVVVDGPPPLGSPLPTRRGSAPNPAAPDDNQPPSYWISLLRDVDNERARERLTEMGTKAVPELRKAARDQNPKLRLAALRVLGAIGENAVNAWNDIAVSLNDPEAAQRIAAADALGKIGKGARPALLPLLRATADPNPAVRAAVGAALDRVGAPAKEDAAQLLALWQEPSPEKRDRFAVAVRLLKPDPETSALLFLPLLKDPENTIRLQAIQVLGEAGDSVRDRTFSKLLPLLDDADANVRKSALLAVRKLGAPKGSDRHELEAGLRAKSVEMRLYCVEQVGLLGQAALPSIPFVARLLGDSEAAVRVAAAKALGRFGKSSAQVLDEILKARGDAEPAVRKEAVLLLGLAGREKGVLAALLDSLGDSDAEVRGAAAAVLRALQPPLGKNDLALLAGSLKDRGLEARRFCATELARIGPDCAPVIKELLAGLHDADPIVRGHVFAALGALGADAKDAVPVLIDTLNTILASEGKGAGSAELFRQASLALGKIAPPDTAVPIWRAGLQTKNKALRKEIAAALAAVGEPARKAVPELCHLLGDPEAGETAGETLAKLGGPDVVKELGRVVDKGNQPAKLAAIRLLSKMGPEAKPALGPLYEAVRVYRGKEIGDAALEAVKKIDKKQ
jgi:HEAT repeat protein